MIASSEESITAEIVTCEPCHRAMIGEKVAGDMECEACRSRVLFAYTMRATRPNRAQPEHVDFHAVPEHQLEIHDRLINWGRSCNGGASADTAPGFGSYQSPKHWDSYGRMTTVPVNRNDATIIGRAVYFLPEPHRIALQWFYVRRTSPMAGRRELGCTAAALARYVVDGRQMLIKRGFGALPADG